jgi:cobalt/nickel transport system ATP-binding protein
MPSNEEIVFDVSGASYSYRDVTALDHVSLKIRRGQRVALLGANGSGKSTLLRLLAGLSFASRGSVSFFGEWLQEARLREKEFFFAFRRRVGVVFQNPDVQLFNASVFDEVAFGPLQLGWPQNQVRERVEETLIQLGIAELRHRAPHRLSGGEKKRVAIASVLVFNPEILILDEPLAALDPASQTKISELLASWSGGAKTVVMATHDLDALEEIADSCCLLENGRVAGEGTPLAILHDIAMLERARLIRPHRHAHHAPTAATHPHLHTQDLENSP